MGESSPESPVAGACLCGAIQYEIDLPTLGAVHCHCTMCRRWNGAGYTTWFAIEKDHLRIVSSQPCLICGRQPAQAHHLAYIQPRARGLKTSDEWTVPLCALHHRQLHDRGNERLFWESHQINPEIAAHELWTGTRTGVEPDVPSGHRDEPQPTIPHAIDETRFMLDPPASEGDLETSRE